jgi:hypothetical protein
MFQSLLAAYYEATILQEQVLRPWLAVDHEEGTGSCRLPSLHVFLSIGQDLGPKGASHFASPKPRKPFLYSECIHGISEQTPDQDGFRKADMLLAGSWNKALKDGLFSLSGQNHPWCNEWTWNVWISFYDDPKFELDPVQVICRKPNYGHRFIANCVETST